MSAEKLYSEILDDFQKEETKEGRINILRKYDHKMFREFLEASFNPAVVFDVEIPNYRPSVEPAGLNYAYLHNEMKKIYRFIANHPKRNPNLTTKKQTQLLLVILEALHKDEAEVMVKMFKKDLGIKYLTAQIVREAYPNINLPK